jgi:hypothetical protein
MINEVANYQHRRKAADDLTSDMLNKAELLLE